MLGSEGEREGGRSFGEFLKSVVGHSSYCILLFVIVSQTLSEKKLIKVNFAKKSYINFSMVQ